MSKRILASRRNAEKEGGEMTIKDADIVRMTGEAGGFDATPVFLKRFAELVAAHEREECAALCFSIWNKWLDTPEEDRYKVLYDAEDCAAAIRARSKA